MLSDSAGGKAKAFGTVMPMRNVVSTGHGDIMVLLDVKSGRYYTAHGVGGRVWTYICEGKPLDALIAHLVQEHSVTPERVTADVQRFVAALLTEGLVYEQ